MSQVQNVKPDDCTTLTYLTILSRYVLIYTSHPFPIGVRRDTFLVTSMPFYTLFD